ncbi:hypothetical protein RFI_17070, partial [Reticulomyxa filosa]
MSEGESIEHGLGCGLEGGRRRRRRRKRRRRRRRREKGGEGGEEERRLGVVVEKDESNENEMNSDEKVEAQEIEKLQVEDEEEVNVANEKEESMKVDFGHKDGDKTMLVVTKTEEKGVVYSRRPSDTDALEGPMRSESNPSSNLSQTVRSDVDTQIYREDQSFGKVHYELDQDLSDNFHMEMLEQDTELDMQAQLHINANDDYMDTDNDDNNNNNNNTNGTPQDDTNIIFKEQ